MKKKKQTVRRQEPPAEKKHGRPSAAPGDEKPSAPANASHAAPASFMKHSALGLPKFPRPGYKPSAKQGQSACEILALSKWIGLRQQRKPSTKDSLKKSFMLSLGGLCEQRDTPASDAGSQLRQLLQECATDSLEKHFATWLPLDSPFALLVSTSNPLIKNKLIFRGFVVPTLCEATVRVAGKMPMKMSLFLRDYSARVRALERLGWEMMIRGAGSEGIQIDGKARRLPERATDFNQLPLPTLDWLVANSADAVQWLARFDAWHQATLKSFHHFHLQFCADMGYQHPGKAFASYLGFAESKTPLSPELLSLLNRQPPLTSSIMSKLFGRNVVDPQSVKYGRKFEEWVRSGKCGQLPGLAIDCWLIEIWPLVVEEEWGYTAILQIAKAKFGVHNSFEKPKRLEKRCQKLHLKLADKPACGGAGIRFKYPLPPLACLAAHVKGIAEQSENWMHGQRGS